MARTQRGTFGLDWRENYKIRSETIRDIDSIRSGSDRNQLEAGSGSSGSSRIRASLLPASPPPPGGSLVDALRRQPRLVLEEGALARIPARCPISPGVAVGGGSPFE